jgi:hypothetical protein
MARWRTSFALQSFGGINGGAESGIAHEWWYQYYIHDNQQIINNDENIDDRLGKPR